MMWHDLKNVPEDFANVIRKQEDFSDRGAFSPIQRAWEGQLVLALRLAMAGEWSEDQLKHHLEATREVLSRLCFALNDNRDMQRSEETIKQGQLFEDFGPGYFDTKGQQRCPIKVSILDTTLDTYLATPTLSCGPLDWIFINAYLRCCVEDLYERIASGALFGEINWPYLLAGGKPGALSALRLLSSILRFAFNWLLMPVAAVYAFLNGHEGWGFVIAATFAAIVVFRAVALPSTIKERRNRRKFERGLVEMMAIKCVAGANIWNPTDLLNRARRFEEDYSDIYLNPILPILARAVERDPHVLSANFDPRMGGT